MANFEVFLNGIKLSANLLFLKSEIKQIFTTYGHILTSSSLDVAKPRSLLSVTTLRGSVHLDMAAGAQSFCAEIIGI